VRWKEQVLGDSEMKGTGSGRQWDERNRFWETVRWKEQVLGDSGMKGTGSGRQWDERNRFWETVRWKEQVLGDSELEGTGSGRQWDERNRFWETWDERNRFWETVRWRAEIQQLNRKWTVITETRINRNEKRKTASRENPWTVRLSTKSVRGVPDVRGGRMWERELFSGWKRRMIGWWWHWWGEMIVQRNWWS